MPPDRAKGMPTYTYCDDIIQSDGYHWPTWKEHRTRARKEIGPDLKDGLMGFMCSSARLKNTTVAGIPYL